MPNVSPSVHQLANGLKVVTINLPGWRSLTTYLVVKVGSRDETAQTNGLAHFLEHMVFKGTEKYRDSTELSAAIEGVGGYLNAWTSLDHTAYWNVVPSEHWRLGLEVASELVFRPKLRLDDLDRERGVILEEIKRIEDDPESLVDDLSGRQIFGPHPLGRTIIGRPAQINGLTIDHFRDFHKEFYKPFGIIAIVVGDLAGKDIVKEVERLSPASAPSDHIQAASSAVPPNSPPKPFSRSSQRALSLHSKPIEQFNFVIAVAASVLKLTDQNAAALEVLNAVLGRGMSSRLFREVREKRGLCYSIRSSLQALEETGILAIGGGVNQHKVPEALSAIKEELSKLVRTPVEDEELTKARNLVIGSLELSVDQPAYLARWYGIDRLFGQTASIEEVIEEVKAVKAASIQRLAEQLFDWRHLTITAVGPGEVAHLEEFLS
ncbi:MAG: pitrilysin family protein [Patescibacteria group bacterium]